MAQIIQSMAQEAGFTVNLLPLETSSAIERYLAGNFELYIGNWSGRADPDPTLYTFFGTGGSQNLNGYKSQELDDVLIAARKELDTDARKALYEQAAEIYLNDRPTIPLYHSTWFYGARASVDGDFDLSGRHPARHGREAEVQLIRRPRPVTRPGAAPTPPGSARTTCSISSCGAS